MVLLSETENTITMAVFMAINELPCKQLWWHSTLLWCERELVLWGWNHMCILQVLLEITKYKTMHCVSYFGCVWSSWGCEKVGVHCELWKNCRIWAVRKLKAIVETVVASRKAIVDSLTHKQTPQVIHTLSHSTLFLPHWWVGPARQHLLESFLPKPNPTGKHIQRKSLPLLTPWHLPLMTCSFQAREVAAAPSPPLPPLSAWRRPSGLN